MKHNFVYSLFVALIIAAFPMVKTSAVSGSGVWTTPSSGLPGQELIINISGMVAGATCSVSFGYIDLAPVTLDSSGNGSIVMTVPATAAGTYSIMVSCPSTFGTVEELASFTVLRQFSLSPIDGKPGDTISLSAINFTGGSECVVSMAGASGSVTGFTIASDGEAYSSFKIPNISTSGDYAVTMDCSDGLNESANLHVTVSKTITKNSTALPKIPTSTPKPTSVITKISITNTPLIKINQPAGNTNKPTNTPLITFSGNTAAAPSSETNQSTAMPTATSPFVGLPIVTWIIVIGLLVVILILLVLLLKRKK